MLTIGMVCEINSPVEGSAFKIGAPWEKLKRQGSVKLLTNGTDRSLVPYWEVQSEEDGSVFAVYDAWLVETGNCLRFFPKCPRRIRAGWYREYNGTCS